MIRCSALDRPFLFTFYCVFMAPCFPRSAVSGWSLLFRGPHTSAFLFAFPVLIVLRRVCTYDRRSRFGNRKGRKKKSNRLEKENISLLFHSSVASPFCIDLSSYMKLFFLYHYCSFRSLLLLFSLYYCSSRCPYHYHTSPSFTSPTLCFVCSCHLSPLS